MAAKRPYCYDFSKKEAEKRSTETVIADVVNHRQKANSSAMQRFQ
jgi:hypothetical protein